MERYIFKLYISRAKEESILTIKKLEEIFDKHLNMNFELNVIDVSKNPHIAVDDKVLIIPALIKSSPSPAKKIFGDLLNEKMILEYLDLPNKNQEDK